MDRITITLRTNSTYEGHNKDNDWSQATSILRSFVLPWLLNWGLQSTIICRFGTVCTLLKMQRCHGRAILKEHHGTIIFLSFKNFSTKRTLQWNTWMFTVFQGTTYTNMIPLFLRVYRKRSINQNYNLMEQVNNVHHSCDLKFIIIPYRLDRWVGFKIRNYISFL